jgi:hypothetical protein
MTLSITYNQHDNALHYAECLDAECCVLFIVMLSLVMLKVIIYLSAYISFGQPVIHIIKLFSSSQVAFSPRNPIQLSLILASKVGAYPIGAP